MSEKIISHVNCCLNNANQDLILNYHFASFSLRWKTEIIASGAQQTISHLLQCQSLIFLMVVPMQLWEVVCWLCHCFSSSWCKVYVSAVVSKLGMSLCVCLWDMEYVWPQERLFVFESSAIKDLVADIFARSVINHANLQMKEYRRAWILFRCG